jgi:hypothetical protein
MGRCHALWKTMKSNLFLVAGVGLLLQLPAHAINAKYAKQLERSGCTQVSEAQGCDITKTKAENAKADFKANTPAPVASPAQSAEQTPYVGQWVAKGTANATVATIRIDNNEHVWVNGKRVKAKRSDGALVFKDGFITYTVQGDRRLKGEDTWHDFDAGSTGSIFAE